MQTPSPEELRRAQGKAMAERGAGHAASPSEKAAVKGYKDRLKAQEHRSIAQEAAAKKNKIDEKVAFGVINEEIGRNPMDKATRTKARETTIDPSTGSSETQRYFRANNAETAILKFLQDGKGMDNFNPRNPADNAQVRLIRDQVKNAMMGWEGASDAFVGKTAAEQNAMVEAWIKDPGFFDKIKQLHEARVLNPDTRAGGEISVKDEEIKALEAEEKAKTDELKKITEDWTKQQGIVESFEDKTASGGAKGANFAKLEQINADILAFGSTPLEDLQQEKALHDREYAEANEELKIEYSGKNGGNKGRIAALIKRREDASNARTDAAKNIGKYNEKARLEALKESAENEVKRLVEEDAAKTKEKTDITSRLAAAKAEKGLMGIDRAESEEAFVKSLEEIYADALDELWGERAAILEEGVNESINEMLGDPNLDPMAKALLERSKNYWSRIDVGGKKLGRFGSEKFTPELDKVKIGNAVDAAIVVADPLVASQQIMEQMLLSTKNPDTGANFTAAEVSAKILSDPEFVKKNMDPIMEGLMAKAIASKSIDQKQMDSFISLGYVQEGRIIDIISNDPDVKAAVEKHGGKLDYFKKNKRLTWWLAMLLLAPGIAIPGGAIFAGYKFFKPGGDGAEGEHGGGH